ncbi:GAF domain-containing protein [Roseomonas fluvialis]|uniref:GAF domain-containing protein n=1 Tax=Roseomonas fluvialis TaxID=1750527 RepID=A0ABN6P060_9PROT|nr:GAF domain-containing protein [Roseomonas fluvialis]BDG71187.1 GAF domain-containing protein [Roseomonas fluvialis]
MTRIEPLPALASAATTLSLPGQPSALFAALQDGTAAAIGHRLFTVMRHDAEAGRNRRAHSSDPAAYPVSGYKPVTWDHPWTRRVLVDGTPWIGAGPADIAWAYPDHEKIAAMGLTTAMNLPVRWNGRTLGTVNLLRATTPFTEADVAIGVIFAALAVPALLTIDAA